jgi:hypothetical protein
MITFEVHPEIHVRELRERPSFSTCSDCHRSFHAKSEDQQCLALCERCLDLRERRRSPTIFYISRNPRSRKCACRNLRAQKVCPGSSSKLS